MKLVRFLAAWLGAAVTVLMRWTSRVHFHNDPRAELRVRAQNYAYAFLHAHQVATVIGGEPGTHAMVSRSTDGNLLVPSLRAHGIVAVRGSSRRGDTDKGGQAALEKLIEHARSGAPVYFAVDGPRGPRGRVQKGIARLANESGAVILPAVAIPRRRWILPRTWDRLQLPKPLSAIDIYFDEPLRPTSHTSAQELRLQLEERLRTLELQHDPVEAKRAQQPPPT